MPLDDAVRRVNSLDSLLALLRDELEWRIEPVAEDATFDWTPGDLRVHDIHAARLKDGLVRQLRPATSTQPWGVFLVEFNDGHVYRSALRQVLRGLVPNRRRDAGLQSWHHEDLLFICTTSDYGRFTFAHFKGQRAQRAKLCTFGWERGDRHLHTLCKENLPRLGWPADGGADAQAWRLAWARAFDKEPLTREFFKRFEKALDAVKTDLEKHHKDMPSAVAYSRAQLLLERMIFLYFVQKRGWLDQQPNFLFHNFQAHAATPQAFSYYQEFLEKVFYALSAPLDAAGREFPGIPFLNGGLFDDDEFAPTPIRMKQNPPLRVCNETFAYVFNELLEAFNFTVTEDTPLNQDVAVDPEMLGKVFESIVLHAEAAEAATAPDKRKATGSYYTPRIVVHFICKEALRQYLLTRIARHPGEARVAQPPSAVPNRPDLPNRLRSLLEMDAMDGLDDDELAQLRGLLTPPEGTTILKLLKDVKCCDPAVGSGAFPVGLMHELVNLRRLTEAAANGYVDPVRQKGNIWIHETKAEIVANSLYGVDIQQQAIEICCLRLWLSLVVDYDIGVDPFVADTSQFRKAIHALSQLPNLEMNFRRGDSLLDLISDVPVRIEPGALRFHRPDFEKIEELGAKLHKERRSMRKKELRVEILRRRLDLTQRVITDELHKIETQAGSVAGFMFADMRLSKAEERRRLQDEVKKLRDALDKVQADRRALDKLASRIMDSDFAAKLRRLEGAEFDSPYNFFWRLDFPGVLAPRKVAPVATLKGEFAAMNKLPGQKTILDARFEPGGFDIIVGNPPFVTARDPVKRELYRERWKRVCSGKFLLVCPFFDLSFGLLKPGGQLGFIVSNAFAKREFGKPLVEDFFPTVDLQKIVDCSGLMFPGHGTPTCIVFGRHQKPDANAPIRVAAILPGGGDLRTPPEESPLWKALAERHEQPGYSDSRVVIADRLRDEIASWPWNLDSGAEPLRKLMERESKRLLGSVEPVGPATITRSDEIFLEPGSLLRCANVEKANIRFAILGESLRDWSTAKIQTLIFPYKTDYTRLKPNEASAMFSLLKPYRETLENVIIFGKPKKETEHAWWEYTDPYPNKNKPPTFIAFTEIATHAHFVTNDEDIKFLHTAPVVRLAENATIEKHHLLSALLNSSAALFWLKQVCFSKRESQEGATDTYFVFAGGKVEQLPVPEAIAAALGGHVAQPPSAVPEQLTNLSRQCWERGRQMPALAMKKLFEKPGEAYHEWNASLPGFVPADPRLGKPFATADDLHTAFHHAIQIREGLRSEMISLQEEMDWLVYQAYGLIPINSGATGCLQPVDVGAMHASPLQRQHRPFCLCQQAEGDLNKAVALIPSDWPPERKSLWKARLETIRDNEHIRRIEQPVYKRRWDEQWKVGNRWQCGSVAYRAEFADAFYWWLSEKAEWWLETQKRGGPVTLEDWAEGLRTDRRISAAWQVAAEVLADLMASRAPEAPRPPSAPSFNGFVRFFTALVKDQSVPDSIPFAVPWEDLEKKMKVPAHVKRIRGKLNVPRERFRITPSGEYVWAGRNI